MSSPFVAEVRIFGFNFAPRGWATCDGQILPISQNTALFSLLGTTYGGNGQSNFALPDLKGSVVVDNGQGPGLSQYYEGVTGGSETVTLTPLQMASHNHTVQAQSNPSNLNAPAATRSFSRATGGFPYQSNASANLVNTSPQSIGVMGASNPHNNMMPYETLLFCIAMQGVFPARS